MASIWDVVTGKVTRKDTSATAKAEAAQATEDARLKRESDTEAQRKADIKSKAKCDVTDSNPSGICFKKGGAVKAPAKAARVAKSTPRSGFKW